MPSTQPTINRPRLTIHIARAVTAQESDHSRDLISDSTPCQRIQLAQLPLSASFPRRVVHFACHACLDESRAYCITTNAFACQLERGSLHDADDGGLGRRVVGRAGIRA